MDLGLDGSSALVAGSSRGIGLAIAQGFLEEGARVTITARDRAPLEAAASDLRSRFGDDRVTAAASDLSTGVGARAAVAAAIDSFGAPDCVVLNAGTGRAPGGWEIGEDGWQASLAANLWTAVHVTEAALPGMVERGSGSLVFITSIAGLEAFGAPLPYGSAKLAVTAYAAGLARQLGPAGIRVNSIAPGNVLFPGGRWDERLQQHRDRVMGMVEREVPLKRFGKPEEIAAAVTFLASERAAGFITGECLVVDGGQTRRVA
jgi:3-oxoacyl-[acyl-carrier protein] reductase